MRAVLLAAAVGLLLASCQKSAPSTPIAGDVRPPESTTEFRLANVDGWSLLEPDAKVRGRRVQSTSGGIATIDVRSKEPNFFDPRTDILERTLGEEINVQTTTTSGGKTCKYILLQKAITLTMVATMPVNGGHAHIYYNGRISFNDIHWVLGLFDAIQQLS